MMTKRYMLSWADIKSPTQVADYYEERLGKRGQNPPGIQCKPHALKSTVEPGGVLELMQRELPEAWAELKIIDARGLNGSLIVYLDIDIENPGGRVIEFLRQHARTDSESQLLKGLIETSNLCKSLRLQAKYAGLPSAKPHTLPSPAQSSGEDGLFARLKRLWAKLQSGGESL